MDVRRDKPLVWLHAEIKTPPFSKDARVEAGFLLRRLQRGEYLRMPQSETMPEIGKHCHQLRIQDGNTKWRIPYRIDSDAIVILEVFEKKTKKTPDRVIETCKKRLKQYDAA